MKAHDVCRGACKCDVLALDEAVHVVHDDQFASDRGQACNRRQNEHIPIARADASNALIVAHELARARDAPQRGIESGSRMSTAAAREGLLQLLRRRPSSASNQFRHQVFAKNRCRAPRHLDGEQSTLVEQELQANLLNAA